MLTAELVTAQRTRMIRALKEEPGYAFAEDTDSGQTFWRCYNPATTECYEVTSFGCTCPDYQARCRRAGILCKHMWALMLRLGTRTQHIT